MKLGRNLSRRLEGRQCSLMARIQRGSNHSNNVQLPPEMMAGDDPLYMGLRDALSTFQDSLDTALYWAGRPPALRGPPVTAPWRRFGEKVSLHQDHTIWRLRMLHQYHTIWRLRMSVRPQMPGSLAHDYDELNDSLYWALSGLERTLRQTLWAQ